MRALALILSLVILGTSADVIPSVTCWFDDSSTYMPNIVMGYNNTGDSTAVILVNFTNDLVGNVVVVFPVMLTGPQPSLFTVGYAPYYMVIRVRDLTAPIKWTINGTASLSVNATSFLTNQNRCSAQPSIASHCPVWIPYFCGDDSYCNGNEICFPDDPNANMGACHRTTEAIDCQNASLVCDDDARACIPIPTPIPTELPTVAPTMAPSVAPTVSPTSMPTAAETVSNEDVCVSNADCVNSSTFCQGAYVCNMTSSLCVQANASYDPCYTYREALRNFYNQTNATSFPISITCVELSHLCIESFTCTNNADCTDNLLCNGVEQCIEGQCSFQTGIVCPGSCVEPTGCTPIDGAESVAPTVEPTVAPTHHHHDDDEPNSLVIGIVAGVLVGLGLIILIIILYFEFSANDSYTASITLGNTVSLSSRANTRINSKYGRAHHD